MPGGGPRRAPGGIPILECVRLARIAPLLFNGGRGPCCCGGAEDNRGGGWPMIDAGGESPWRGLDWFTILMWWSIA